MHCFNYNSYFIVCFYTLSYSNLFMIPFKIISSSCDCSFIFANEFALRAFNLASFEEIMLVVCSSCPE